MRVQDIEVHVGDPGFAYEPVRRLEAKVEATTAFSAAPNIDEANMKLRELAAKVGANAIVDVEYNSGISLTSWRSMTATGLAVKRQSDEVACPSCAELIKRAARKCRFCGTEIDPAEHPAAATAEAPAPAAGVTIPEEPLKATNNTGIYWVIGGIAVITVISMLGTCSSMSGY